MQPNEPEITNSKTVTDNSVILNAVETLLSSAGYDTNQLNVALDVLKNAKEQSLVDKKEENVFWLDKTFIYEDIDDCFIYRRADSVSGRWYLRLYDEKNNKPVVRSLKTTDKIKIMASSVISDISTHLNLGKKIGLESRFNL